MMETGQTAIKVIAVVGLCAFVLLWVSAAGCRKMMRPQPSERVQTPAKQSPFDGKRAFENLKTVVEFGPRPPGSEALGNLREFIKAELTKAGLEVREHAFDAATPVGTRAMVNVTGVVQGTKPEVIILGNHYDTKYLPDFTFVGANDGGSTTAWILEMAQALGPQRDGHTLWLCFFDGEEAFEKWSPTDSLYGSRAFVAHLREQGQLPLVKVVINMDMIGDCYLGIKRDSGAPQWLTDAVWNEAADLGYERNFLASSQSIEDDHLPFRKAGIPSMDIIDFSYGGSLLDHVRNWHTGNDTLDKVCWESLQAVGDVVYHSLQGIEDHLNEAAGQR